MNKDPKAKEKLKSLFARKLKKISIEDIIFFTRVSGNGIKNYLVKFSAKNPRRVDIFIQLSAALDLSEAEINMWLEYYGKPNLAELKRKFPRIVQEQKTIARLKKQLKELSAIDQPKAMYRFKYDAKRRSVIRKIYN